MLWGIQFSIENYRFFYTFYGTYSFLQKTIAFYRKLQIFLQNFPRLWFSIENYRFFYRFYRAYSFLQKFLDFSIVFYRILYIFLQILWGLQFSVKLYRKLQIVYSMQGVYSFLKNILYRKTIDFSIDVMGPIVFYRKLQIFLQKTIDFSMDFMGPIVFYRKLQIFLQILWGLQFSIENYIFFYSLLKNSIDFSIDCMGSIVFYRILQETVHFLQNSRGLQFSKEYFIEKLQIFLQMLWGLWFSIENYRFFYSLLKNSIDFSIDCMGSIVFYRILQETIHFLQNSRGLQFSKEYFIEKLQIFLQILQRLWFSIENYRFFYSLLKNSIDFSNDCMGSIVFYRILQETIHFLYNSRGLQFSKEYFIEKLQIFLQMLWGLWFSIENYRFFYRKQQIFLWILWGLQFSIENYRFFYTFYGAYSFLQKTIAFYRKLQIFLQILQRLWLSIENYRFF